MSIAIGSTRCAVGTILPALTKVAWQIKSQEIRKDAPGITRKFLYNLSRSSYEKSWGATYQRPGLRSRLLAAASSRSCRESVRSMALAFKKLTPETEKLYMTGFTRPSNGTVSCWQR